MACRRTNGRATKSRRASPRCSTLVHMSEFARAQAAAIVRRPAAAHRAGALPRDRSRRCCCSTSRSARSTRICGSTCRSRSSGCQRESGITTILVTHDQEEALSMADRIAVMSRGRIEQVSSPTEIYDAAEDVVRQRIRRHHQRVCRRVRRATAAASRVTLPDGIAHRRAVEAVLHQRQQASSVSIRPEQLRIVADPAGARRHRQGGDAARRPCHLRDRADPRRCRSRSASRAKATPACGRPARRCISPRRPPTPAMSFHAS